MSKTKSSLNYVFKIRSSRLRRVKFDLWLTPKQARSNKELVSLSSSQTLRFIEKISPPDYDKERLIDEKKSEVARLKKSEENKENKLKLSKAYNELLELQFVKEYALIIMDNNTDFDRLNSEKGFLINGKKFKRLLATTGGGKKSTIVYVSEDTYDDLKERLDMGREPNKPIIPAKLEAYKALACSASTPVSRPKGVLVVKDVETSFFANVITIDDRESDYPIIEARENYPVNMNASDGFGLMLPNRSKTWGEELGVGGHPSLVIRHGFTKGMLFPFDYIHFAEHEAKNFMVPDAWGDSRDIREYDVILTTSMVKLWDSYDDLEHLQKCWDKHDYTFAVTKATPEKLDNEGNLNYQFIQSLELTDEEISELISETVQEIKDVLGGDYRKAILYLNGKELTEKSVIKMKPDYLKALMIDKEMINDPYVRTHIHNMIKNRINEVKTGDLKVKGNFSVMSGDPFTLCQSIFGMPLTGLLNEGEFYSKYWIDKGVSKVAAFRAPMTNHNNIRIFRFKNSDEIKFWFQYMKNVTILNSWDTTTHALNGADFDGDQVFTTNNKVILDNVKELDAIICMQKSVKPVIPTEEDLIKANKASFGDEIGTTTNRITSMFDVLARYEKGTPQYEAIMERIMSGQMIQQNVIDKTKGVEANGMPKEWYEPRISYPPVQCDSKGKVIKDDQGKVIPLDEPEEQRAVRELNLEIVANKKPYFFIWKKDSLEFGKYRKYIESTERNCFIRFGMTVKELIGLNPRTDEQDAFVKHYYDMMPVSISNSTMNRICWKIEDEFKNFPLEIKSSKFDIEMLKTNKKYSQRKFSKIIALYEEHNTEMRDFMKNKNEDSNDDEDKQGNRNLFVNRFKEDASLVCSNEEDLCNMVIDLCYKNNRSKQFAWDVSGEQIIRNLESKNNNTYSYPLDDEQGDFEFAGDKFTMITVKMEADSY